ncbi:hypothetical protein EIN_429740 [Entamoeba invadens IP1]|uniref:Uncharacterized protein n=1 Tax=Entamoeba invadens IP1 TaxID=370355 RepID=A0A0A1UFD2_ENTIV|nr:hypothetical protein EIN_429740 [Entamoeba invadens IP1]ELP95198.1 hypothetical protein EIN_429740 [Entamoeba invadens IP1]|eukprot:XP_004261969.1 hypothetical protein EIN_429740 [Entamoeba invadens IP1]
MLDKELLDSLLFDPSSNLLMSICCNLIYDPKDPFCQTNALCVMDYFRANNRLQDLFIWAFQKEFLQNGKPNDITETYPFFSAFNYQYTIDNFFDFCKETTKSFLSNKDLLHSINIQLFKGNTEEFTKEMNEEYYVSIQQLLKIVFMFRTDFEINTKLIPTDYLMFLKGISDLLSEQKYKEKGFTNSIFSRIIKLTIINFMKNKRMLRRAFQDIDQDLDVILFIAETFEKLMTHSTEPYILNLNALVKDFNEFGQIDALFERTSFAIDEATPLKNISVVELASLIKCNILPVKRMLHPKIRAQVDKALSLSATSDNDFDIYVNVLHSFEAFSRNYYMYLTAALDEINTKNRQIAKLKAEYEKTNEILRQKKVYSKTLQMRLYQLQPMTSPRFSDSKKVTKSERSFLSIKSASGTTRQAATMSSREMRKSQEVERKAQKKLLKEEIKKKEKLEREQKKKKKEIEKKLKKVQDPPK